MKRLKLFLFHALPWKEPKEFAQATAAAAGQAPSQAPGTFVTPSSIVTFSGATIAVVTLTKVIGLFWDLKVGNHQTIASFSLAVIIGGILFWLSVDDPASRPKTPAQWAVAVVVALVNIAYLGFASLGIPLAFNNQNTAQQ